MLPNAQFSERQNTFQNNKSAINLHRYNTVQAFAVHTKGKKEKVEWKNAKLLRLVENSSYGGEISI